MCQTLFSSPDLPPSLAPYHEPASASDVPPSYIPYLEKTRWPGRCQTVIDPLSDAEGNVTTTWFLDGAHTVESLTSCGEWVYGPDGMDSTATSSSTEGTPSRRKRRVLIFNCTSGRSAYALLGALLDAGKKATGKSSADVGSWFDRVIFCTNVTYVDGHFKGGE
jgi:folylpolyglutamate synthase